MKIDRKRYGMKRRSSGGQAILEYIIVIALVAVAALTVLGLFGGRIKTMISGATGAIGGENSGETHSTINVMNSDADDDLTL